MLLVVAFCTGALLSPPDPLTQLLYVGPGVGLSILLATLFTYGDGYERLGVLPSGRDHVRTVPGFLAVTTLGEVLVTDPTAPVPNVAALLAGLLVGAWVGWGRGRERLGFRSRNA